MKRLIIFIALCAVLFSVTGCRTTKTIASVTTDTLRQIHGEKIDATHVTESINDAQHWNTELRIITLTEKGDTIHDVQRICTRDTIRIKVGTSDTLIKVVTDTIQKSHNQYIRITTMKKLSWWQEFKIKYFVWILALALLELFFIVVYFCTPIQKFLFRQ